MNDNGGAGDAIPGNALGQAKIIARPDLIGEQVLPFTTLRITGHITLVDDLSYNPDGGTGWGDAVQVAEGASLGLEGVALTTGIENVIEGSLIVNRSIFLGNLTISPSGKALLLNSFLQSGRDGGEVPNRPAITNRGSLTSFYSLLSANGENSPPVATLGGGHTTLGASWLFASNLSTGGVTTCEGTLPISVGYNRANGCDLTGLGDQDSSSDAGVHDVVPFGELGCGTGVNVDFNGNVRPADDDGDGTPACDIGPWEGP